MLFVCTLGLMPSVTIYHKIKKVFYDLFLPVDLSLAPSKIVFFKYSDSYL